LCFIGKVKLPEFLQQQLKPKEGVIVEIPDDHKSYQIQDIVLHSIEEELIYKSRKIAYSQSDGKIVGKHQGAHYFTKGQRKGLGVGGTTQPLYIIDTDVNGNIIYVGRGNRHPGLFKPTLFVVNKELHWVREDLRLKTGNHMKVMARIRYRQPLQKAQIFKVDNGLYVSFEKKQSAITEGQFVAWYLHNELVGSGVIA